MIDFGFDFTGRSALVTGGTRGVGLAVADALVRAGAEVTITGTKLIPRLYDEVDLSRFKYEQLQLSNPDAIDRLVEQFPTLDILVNSAGAVLPRALDAAEVEFLAHSARLGLIGPQRLTRKLRSALRAAPGAVVINTGGARRWIELTQPDEIAEAEIETHTGRLGRVWRSDDIRVNTVLELPKPAVKGAPAPRQGQRADASGSTRGQVALLHRPLARAEVASVVSFLVSSGAVGVTGQTIRVEA